MEEKWNRLLPLSERRNIDGDQLQSWYEVGLDLFAAKKYEEAADSFFFLAMLNPYVSTFWVALGMVEQSRKRFDEAIEAYMMAGVTNPGDPLPFYYLAKCYASKGELEEADQFLELAKQAQMKGKVSLGLVRSIEEARVFVKKAKD